MCIGKRVVGWAPCLFLVLALGCGDDGDSTYNAGNGGDGDLPGSGGSGGDGDGGGDGDSGGDGDGDGDGGGDGDSSLPIEKPAEFFAGDDPDRNQVTPGQICERLSTIQCASEAWCCDNLTRTEQSCKQTMLAGCRELLLDGIAMDPIVAFDEAHAATAFTEFEAKAAACDPTIASFGASREGLLGMQKGTISAGASCKPPAALPTATQGGAALAACLDSATHACLPGLTSWTCDARGGVGGDCFTDSNCTEGLFCDNPQLLITGDACQARKANGTACSADNHCMSLTCRSGSCVEATQQTAYCLQ